MAATAARPCPSAVAVASVSANTTSSKALQRVSFVGLRPTAVRSLASTASRNAVPATRSGRGVVTCGLEDFVGGDLLGFDLGQWVDDVEKFGSIGVYAPAEGGAEGRYATSLKYSGYHLMNVSARGLGDPEAYLLKVHGVRPPHLGRQAVARFYLPPEVDARLAVLPPKYKGLVLWVGEGKVLARNELQFLALLPALRPNVKVIVEMGCSRKFYWKPMKDLVGLPTPPAATAAAAPSTPATALVTEEAVSA
eukprot:TRINITY_DN16818_c0_g1_i1.p1 TRINITY_DN16818_c0_g1~~TRINITY_DN16818_c0_g1_i1.p1  ORF type:complete len:271 (-),score=3.94 TRINITY_DN16818_c0_g1_i1:253-1005(-)